jgi:hypothetical protein
MEKELGYRFQEPAEKTCKFMDNQTKFNTNIEIAMKGLTKDLGYIKESLEKNEDQHKEILTKIDHLGDTFQGKIQDKADQKEVMEKMDTYVQMETFRPIQKLVYGLVGAMLLACVAAFMALILK